MAVRIRSQWFRHSGARSPTQNAGAMALNVWRLGQDMLKRLRTAGFDIEAGPAYFAFLREVLVFLALVLDRWAHASLDAAGRLEFSTALVSKLAEVVAENETALLGPPAANMPSHAERTVALFDELGEHFAEFGCDSEGPDFGFLRYFGVRIGDVLPIKDRRWVLDEVMSVHAPAAVAMLRKGFLGLTSDDPPPRRRGVLSSLGD